MNLDKKLGIWNVDKIVDGDGFSSAEYYYCVCCYEHGIKTQAQVLGPTLLRNIKESKEKLELYPYCIPCDVKMSKKIVC
ncbi:MAG TPA: hypothetical protein HA284_00990 [Nanoarchaeota archaeon]|nr:MAG: hypothetical protein QJ16_C0005G0217 [archaeon GW2011_AR1]HIH52093.1 hypothetical protein [Nanoarchaeota archaeon]